MHDVQVRAGSALDELVARQIMEIHPGAPCDGFMSCAADESLWRCNKCAYQSVDPPGAAHRVQVLPYSSDIRAAWLVVERMTARRMKFGLERFFDGLYYVSFTQLRHTEAYCYDTSAAVAICRAALKAINAGKG